MKNTTGIKSVLETIDPKRAGFYLTKNKRNRAISENAVNAYAADMRNGNWLPSHQGIAFNDRGELIDGQHRLAAIIQAEMAVPVLVTTGLRDEKRNGVTINVMDTVDRGRVRSIGQQLSMFHGVTYGVKAAAVCNCIVKLMVGEGHRRLTTSQVLHIWKLYGSDFEAIYSYPDAKARFPAFVAAPMVVLHNTDKASASGFASRMISLEGLRVGDPVAALVKWREHYRNMHNPEWQTTLVTITALHHHKHGTAVKRLSPSLEALEWLVGTQKANQRKIVELLHIAADK